MTVPTMPDEPAHDHLADTARQKVAELEIQLAEVEETLRAIRTGVVDAITVTTSAGEQVFSLKGAEQPYREMIEAMSEGAVNVTPEGMVLYCNQCFADMAKTDLKTVMGSSLQAYFSDQDRTSITAALHEHGTTRVRAQIMGMDGQPVPVNVAMHRQADGDNRSIVITVISDLTQIVAAQEATARTNLSLEHANRALHMLNLCNTTIIHAAGEEQVLADTCRALVDSGGYKLAWVGYAEHDARRSVRPVAWADGTPDYVEAAQVSWGDDERGHGPAGTAIRSGHMAVVRDTDTDATFGPWREMARREDFHSVAAVPLRSGDDVFGALMVYSRRPGAFDEQETVILAELADDLACCITNLRRKERLAETKAFLDNILESSTKYSIISEDLDRRILFWNEGARRNYGYAADEIVGKSQEVLQTPEDCASGAVDRLMEIAHAKGLAEAELQRVRKDGSQFPASVVVTRRDDAAGNPIGYLVISNDISEKRRAEERVRVAAQYARSLIEASIDPLMTISPDGKITDANHATELITGQTRDHLIGSDFAVYFTEPEKARAGYRRVFTKGFVIDYPLAIRHVTGIVTEALCNASLYRDANGEVTGVLATIRDISRLPPSDLVPLQKRRGQVWRYLGFAAVAVVFFVLATAVPVFLRDWLQQLQEQSSIIRSTATSARMQNLLLEVHPTPARVRAAKVQFPPGTDAGLGYVSEFAVAAPNHSPGIIGMEQPMSRFSNEMPVLSTGNCAHLTEQLTNQTPDASAFIVCPIAGKSHRLIGLLFMSWDRGDPAPTNFDAAIAATRQAGLDIAAIWAGDR
jgi:PAS domain S-box-containing protein